MSNRSASTSPADDSSYTAAGEHTTAAAMGKHYEHDFRTRNRAGGADGKLTSNEYLRRVVQGEDETVRPLRIEYHHILERYLGTAPFRWLLQALGKDDVDGITTLERILLSYRSGSLSWMRRLLYWPVHLLLDRLRGSTDVETFQERIVEHTPTLRGLVIVARSISEFGLTIPQRFSAPLFAVWNFTNQCNLACQHCYQDSEKRTLAGELSLEEKLELVDQMGRAHMPMLALSGGEPTLSQDLVPVLERASGYGMHLTLATNGTTMTPAMAGKLAGAGLRYVEISLDSVHPERHDTFRGMPGMWERSVAGAKTVVATEGLRLGIAMCVHQGNYHEVGEMIDFAESIGAGCFAHFNFIPVGRGLRMVSGDITPDQREKLLALLNEKMQAGGIGVISTAPQLGRVCLAGAAVDDGRVACSHAGAGSGVKARVVAKYLGGCGAGRTYVCIEPSGNVTPCVYLPHRVMGNVRQKPLLDIFRKSVFSDVLNDRDQREHHCRVCRFRQYCGGCRARADAYFGRLQAGDPGCLFNAKHWDDLVARGVAVPGDAETVVPTPTPHGPG